MEFAGAFDRPLFIVVDGLDAVGKTTLSRSLATALSATQLKCPPRLELHCPVAEMEQLLPKGDLRQHFDTAHAVVRRAYYRAANLVASEQAGACLESGRHVVMDRYWTSTVAFAAMDEEEASGGVEAGTYPPELRIPDVVILLTVDESTRAERMRGRGETTTNEERKLAHDTERRGRVLEVYRKFEIVEIDTSNLDPAGVLEEVLYVLKEQGGGSDRRRRIRSRSFPPHPTVSSFEAIALAAGVVAVTFALTRVRGRS